MNSFEARSTLEVGDREYEIYRLDALQAKFDVARLPFSLKILLENLLRHEDGPTVDAADIEALATLGRDRRAEPRDRLHAGARAAAGLHRRARGRRPRRDARRDAARWAATRRGSTRCSRPSWSSTTRCRSTSSARRGAFQLNAELEFERNQRALRLPALGPAGVPQLRGRAARHRHRAPGEPRVPRARRVRAARPTASAAGLPRHAGRHRLAHDDDQRPRRARLGRRRHRGRGGDARPAGVDADPAGGRLPARRRAAARARPRPTSC